MEFLPRATGGRACDRSSLVWSPSSSERTAQIHGGLPGEHGVPLRLPASLRTGVLTDGEDLAHWCSVWEPGREVMGSEMRGAGD